MKDKPIKYVVDSRCFPGYCITSLSDGIHSDYGGETLEELKIHDNNPCLIAVSENTLFKMAHIYEQSLCGPFQEITEEEYYDNMDVLPPIRQKKNSFFISEPYYGNVYTFCFTIGRKYFKGLRSVRTFQTELERQMNEHYHQINFKGKIITEHPYILSDKQKRDTLVVPYFFIHADGKKRFICNLTFRQGDTEDICKARKDMANILSSLRKHHFLYFCGYDRKNNIECFLDDVQKKEYTLVANDSFFQFPINRESVSFTGNVKETGEPFFYRIYDRRIFLYLMHRLRSIKREKNRNKSSN